MYGCVCVWLCFIQVYGGGGSFRCMVVMELFGYGDGVLVVRCVTFNVWGVAFKLGVCMWVCVCCTFKVCVCCGVCVGVW